METTNTKRNERARLFVSGTPPSALPAAEDVDATVPWWMTPYGRWRLSVETAAMSERFPSFRLTTKGGGLCWVGRLRSSITRRRYPVRVTYPAAFPDYPPEVGIERHRFPAGVPHLLEGTRPCLYAPAQGWGHGYDPARTTAATMVAWTALWIHAYETWRETGSWPGSEA